MDEKQWFVYLLECGDGSVYTGITNNVEKRMKAHKSGSGSKYVKQKKFKQLLYTIKAVDKVDAAKMEYRIKQLTRNNKIDFFLNHPMLDFSIVKKN
jgi:putative endonuclease